MSKTKDHVIETRNSAAIQRLWEVVIQCPNGMGIRIPFEWYLNARNVCKSINKDYGNGYACVVCAGVIVYGSRPCPKL